MSVKVLVTGIAGFVGMHVAKSLKDKGFKVVGIDNLNDYYDVSLKVARLRHLGLVSFEQECLKAEIDNLVFYKIDLCDREAIDELFKEYNFSIVINLAAQAGVRFSITHPKSYIDSNINGFFNILDASNAFKIDHLIYASSSSVYGNSMNTPFCVEQRTDKPISMYAATKKANELMAETYSHLHSLSTSGLRFFTVYGPYGRPDMAYFSFTKSILEGKPIKLFNGGDLHRDFTYIDDIVNSIVALCEKGAETQGGSSLYNIGRGEPQLIKAFVTTLEELIGKKALVQVVEKQPGDVDITYADISTLQNYLGIKPEISLREGLTSFYDWYNRYYV